jgi:hypothetical protein
MTFQRKALLLHFKPQQTLNIRSATLTPAGREVLKIVEATDDAQMIAQIGKFFKSLGAERVEMTDVISTSAGPQFANAVEISS